MIRRLLISVCVLLATAFLTGGWMSRTLDLFLFESENAPTRFYRAFDARPWKHTPPEIKTDEPGPAAAAVGFCEGRFRVDCISAVRLIEPPPTSADWYSAERPPLHDKIDLPVLRLRAGPMTPDRSDLVPYYAVELTVSSWLPAGLFGVWPAWALIRGPIRRRRRRTRGQCPGCGYDLTGNMSGLCPECGKAIAKATE
jgi:hypothetical protein